MKLNYKRTILVGFAFFLISAFWQAYDATIPVILTNKFGMSQTWSGVIMALDNILAVFMLNERGAVVKYELKPIVCANGSSIMGDSGKVTLTTDNADPAQSKITHASAFLWDCTGGLPTWQNSVMEELAPDVYVEK